MSIDCAKIDSATILGVEVVPAKDSGSAAIVFDNNSNLPLWFPVEGEPAYRLDKEAGILYIWFGYFEEIYGKYSDKYIVPELRTVEPGKQIKINLTSRELAQVYMQHAIPLQIQARISTIAIEHSNVRGSQPLPEYLQNSCIIKSPVITPVGQPAQ